MQIEGRCQAQKAASTASDVEDCEAENDYCEERVEKP